MTAVLHGAAAIGPLAEALGFQQALLLIALIAGVPAALVLLAPSVRAIGRGDQTASAGPIRESVASQEAIA